MLSTPPYVTLDDDFWQPSSKSLKLTRLPVLTSTYARSHPHETIKSHYEQVKALCQAHVLEVACRSDQPPVVRRHDPNWVTVKSRRGHHCAVHEIQRLMDFDVSFLCNHRGIYMPTELGHGLDARNLQTVATLLPDGGFDLHTPTPAAAKCMPVATPISGLQKIATVFARLHVNGQDHCARGFVVQLNVGSQMAEGITAKLLPNRAGSTYLDHAITVFNHVRLPKNALLGEIRKIPVSEQDQFSSLIWRVPVGTFSLAMASVPTLKICSSIAARYAMKRRVGHSVAEEGLPITHFRTQQIPIFHAIAQASVLAEYATCAVQNFTDRRLDPRVRHAHAMFFKTIAMAQTLESTRTLSLEMGWRGFSGDNQIIRAEYRGNKIAEGDTTVLCIRLASDILLGKVAIHPLCPLAKHESVLLNEAQVLLKECGGNFRSPASNRHLLPRCQALVEAIGFRMAYEAARDAHIDPVILKLYEMGATKSDLACYVEHKLLTRREVFDIEDKCISALVPRINELLDKMDMDAYCDAPIISDEKWDSFLSTLDTFSGGSVLC
ncbi:putative acyl-CoA oxidase [Aspergillus clavatus NRRL 1]|uniref:Acyl-CoA oxidase, putative n=1 Tax=Aspergillus clavatus (strain ATCC 1007 / CBS 513.65 / DSM 816 / NCTC 3887 / NRRL 1 / QM 1276 / 107) TaxID=344612 RepID=A1C599_ASPCL|nr:acyl-CoA oxidase, putative [Aspergillus clavatus NRRL 1]EAW14867.1 acyl-CoA oxidase, putative [Aspergillus clavatus NRRL 1]